jgi:hypothetical protein
MLVLCALEGAFVVAKTTRSRTPFRDCAKELAPLVAAPPS